MFTPLVQKVLIKSVFTGTEGVDKICVHSTGTEGVDKICVHSKGAECVDKICLSVNSVI